MILQDNAGTVLDADAYIEVQFFKDYHDARGNDYTAAADDTAIERAIVRATGYLDTRFSYVGRRLQYEQATQWPRVNAWDHDRFYVTGIPRAVKEATAEYALRALIAELNPDPLRDESGRLVIQKAEVVGPISESTTYAEGVEFVMPRYPEADQKLRRAGLVVSGGTVRRG